MNLYKNIQFGESYISAAGYNVQLVSGAFYLKQGLYMYHEENTSARMYFKVGKPMTSFISEFTPELLIKAYKLHLMFEDCYEA